MTHNESNAGGSYIEQISKEVISYTDFKEASIKTIENNYTYISMFANELRAARNELIDYFRSSSEESRPFNSLLLGPPGSGKSYVARMISSINGNKAESDKRTCFLEYNLSQLHHPKDLQGVFDEMYEKCDENKIVLFDEFDVSVGNSSVIRYLIQPMYDGKFGQNKIPFGRTAFIFSGSYLKNRSILQKLQREYSVIDLPKFLYDLFQSRVRTDSKDDIKSLFEMSILYHKYREETALEGDLALYLRSLDKLPDFLSRIGGFIIEIPDLSSPLEVTEPWHALLPLSASDTPVRVRAAKPDKVLEWVQAEEEKSKEESTTTSIASRYKKYIRSETPILEYKDMIIKERLLRTLYMLKKAHLKDSKNELRIDRSSLNYLCTAPLVHGMRSLEYLVGALRPIGENENSKLVLETGDIDQRRNGADLAKRHVRQEGRFRNHVVLWERLICENYGASSDQQRGTISVRF